jgi:hypothetical protein
MMTRRVYWHLHDIARELEMTQSSLVYWLLLAAVTELQTRNTDAKVAWIKVHLDTEMQVEWGEVVERAMARAARDGVPW